MGVYVCGYEGGSLYICTLCLCVGASCTGVCLVESVQETRIPRHVRGMTTKHKTGNRERERERDGIIMSTCQQ